MSGRIRAKLAELGLTLPPVSRPVANYLPWTQSGTLLFISGQVPLREGKVAIAGRLGAEVQLEEGREAARLCALHLLAQAEAALGDLDRIRRCLRVGGFVTCTPEFTDHPQVINGASDLLVAVLGEAGRHARVAVGVPSLPLNAAVEVEALFEVAD